MRQGGQKSNFIVFITSNQFLIQSFYKICECRYRLEHNCVNLTLVKPTKDAVAKGFF